MILLDTNVVVAYLNGDKPVLKRIQADIAKVALSTLVVAELDYGAKASQRAKENLEKLYQFLNLFKLSRLTLSAQRFSGRSRANSGAWASPQEKWMFLLLRLPWATRPSSLHRTKDISKTSRG